MSLLSRREEGAANGAPIRTVELDALRPGAANGLQIPGVAELKSICDNARRIIDLCELVGVGKGPLDNAHHVHTRDHLDPPWAWELN